MVKRRQKNKTKHLNFEINKCYDSPGLFACHLDACKVCVYTWRRHLVRTRSKNFNIHTVSAAGACIFNGSSLYWVALNRHKHTHTQIVSQWARCTKVYIRNQPSIETRPIMISLSLLCHCFESLTKPVCMCLCLAGRCGVARVSCTSCTFINGYSVTANQLVYIQIYVSTTCNNVDTLYFTCNAYSFSSFFSSVWVFFVVVAAFGLRCRLMEMKNELCVFV